MSYICEFCGIRPENCTCSLKAIDDMIKAKAVEKHLSYGLLDAPSASAFFSLLVDLEKEEIYDNPFSGVSIGINSTSLSIPKLERQTNGPTKDTLIFDESFSEFIKTQEDKQQLAREAYELEKECDTYKFSEDEDEDELFKCPTCEEMIDMITEEQCGMCYACFTIEQRLYPDDIPMELRYRDSF